MSGQGALSLAVPDREVGRATATIPETPAVWGQLRRQKTAMHRNAQVIKVEHLLPPSFPSVQTELRSKWTKNRPFRAPF